MNMGHLNIIFMWLSIFGAAGTMAYTNDPNCLYGFGFALIITLFHAADEMNRHYRK